MAVPIMETVERQGQVREEIRRLAAALRARGAVLVVLFGSRARGDATRWSDIDMLTVLPCPQGETYAGRLARLATELAVDDATAALQTARRKLGLTVP